LGNQIGRIYVDKQDLSKLQTRKMKGLKKHLDPVEESAPAQADDGVEAMEE
jgi:ribosome production factor 2